jgi:hypothetical protein
LTWTEPNTESTSSDQANKLIGQGFCSNQDGTKEDFTFQCKVIKLTDTLIKFNQDWSDKRGLSKILANITSSDPYEFNGKFTTYDEDTNEEKASGKISGK